MCWLACDLPTYCVVAGMWSAYLVYVLAGMWPAYLVYVLAGMWPAYLVCVGLHVLVACLLSMCVGWSGDGGPA